MPAVSSVKGNLRSVRLFPQRKQSVERPQIALHLHRAEGQVLREGLSLQHNQFSLLQSAPGESGRLLKDGEAGGLGRQEGLR